MVHYKMVNADKVGAGIVVDYGYDALTVFALENHYSDADASSKRLCIVAAASDGDTHPCYGSDHAGHDDCSYIEKQKPQNVDLEITLSSIG